MSVQVLSKRSELLSRARVPHLTDSERAQVAELLARLEQQCQDDVQRIILYGSKARGDSNQESDVDLLIAAKGDAEGVKRIVTELQRDIDFRLYPVIYDRLEHESNKRLLPPFYVNVRRDGIELWDVVAAELEEHDAPLNFSEGKKRPMNQSTLELIKQYWEQTEYFWQEAMYLKQGGFLRSAVSRSFYAVFHALSAVLYTYSIVRGKHSAVESAMHEFLIQPRLLEPEYGKIYSHLMRGRHLADYGSIRKPGERPQFETLTEDEMTQMLDEAERFIARMKIILLERGAIID